MAKNIVFNPGYELAVVCSDPATPASGGPVRYGSMTGLALTDERTDGLTSCNFGPFVATLSVKGIDGSGNSAVAVGDALWYVDADTPKLSKKAAGYFFGFALETVNSGATTTIKVMHVPGASGSGTLAAGSIGTTQLANNGVTAGKLTASLAIGFIPLLLQNFREIATNDIINTAGGAGMLSSNTTPILQRVNGATDKQIRIHWAASNNDEITSAVVSPPDLDDTAAVEVHILAAMSGATNTPTVAVGFFEGVGDTNAGGNTAAITGTGVAEYTVSIAAGDIAASPQPWSISLTPAAHTTDALYVYGAWIEYTRK